jgi:hypothetical protein
MSILRVHYAERQRLRADDLRLEQDWRLGRAGRHELGHHHWGVARGLRVLADADGRYWLQPGIAVDGYGREVEVPAPVPLDLAGLRRRERGYVLLWYCEQALPACPGQAPVRVAARPVVRVLPTEYLPGPAPDLALARAAGTDGLAPWPILVATIDLDQPAAGRIGHAGTRYASGSAAIVRAPHGRAEMVLGQRDRRDVFRFLVSTRDPAGLLAPRIGIDRDHGLHVWRALHISASMGLAQLTLKGKVQLRVAAPLPAGLGRRVWISGRVDTNFAGLDATLAYPDGVTAASDKIAKPQGKSVPLPFRDGRLAQVSLWNSGSRKPLTFGDGRQMLGKEYRKDTFRASLDPLDGRLLLKNRAAGPVASALVLRPAAAGAGADAGLAIGAVAEGSAAHPRSVLRLAGGTRDATDAASRLTIGAGVDGDHLPGLEMDAGGNLNVPGRGADAAAVLDVRGTVYLPPIDAKDPLLPDLLMLAYIGGLCRVGKFATAPDIVLEPWRPSDGSTVTRPPSSYIVNIESMPGGDAQRLRMMELITDVGGNGEVSFRSLAPPPGAVSFEEKLPALPGDRPRQVTVLMLLQIGGDKRVAVSDPLPLQPAPPPTPR